MEDRAGNVGPNVTVSCECGVKRNRFQARICLRNRPHCILDDTLVSRITQRLVLSIDVQDTCDYKCLVAGVVGGGRTERAVIELRSLLGTGWRRPRRHDKSLRPREEGRLRLRRWRRHGPLLGGEQLLIVTALKGAVGCTTNAAAVQAR